MPKRPSSVHEFASGWWHNTSGHPCGPYATRDLALEAERIYLADRGTPPLPVLIGMNNPYGTDERYALYPRPERATGWRVWQMLVLAVPECTEAQYRDRFARYNIMTGRDWNLAEARRQAPRLVDHWLGNHVLVFGKQTRDAMWLPAVEPLTWHTKQWGNRMSYWAWAPHPSGRNQWYNDPANREAAGHALGQMYRHQVVPNAPEN